jgi:hypothetical protein
MPGKREEQDENEKAGADRISMKLSAARLVPVFFSRP